MSEEKIIEIETERTIGENLLAVGEHAYNTLNKNNLPIIGLLNETSEQLVLVVDKKVTKEVMEFVQYINARSHT